MSEFSIGVMMSHQLAAAETAASNHQFILPDHLFNGITKLEDLLSPADLRKIGLPSSLAEHYTNEVKQLLDLLRRFNLNPRQIRRSVRHRIGNGGYQRAHLTEHISRSPESRAAFVRALEIAEQAGAPLAGIQHLLAALLEIENTRARQLLTETGMDVNALREALAQLPITMPDVVQAATFLTQFGIDLTQQAREGKLPPVIGRDQEMLQVIRALSRDKKNNPVLVGEAGVGKTAIVEGIASRIAEGTIHPDFRNKRLIQINASNLVAGTKYRGDFEQRMQGLIDEATASEDVILFMDEIHLLVGAGAGEGAMDAANILKPALARGDIRLIGATTFADYHQYIEKDAALERRFQPIRVDEPSPAQARAILQGLRTRLEQHHGVTIRDDAIDAAVQMSVRYVPDRRLPDKAYDLLDEACAWIHYGSTTGHDPYLDDSGDADRKTVTVQTVRKVVGEMTGIPLDRLTAGETERLLKMADTLRQRVIGQDQAVETVARVVQRAHAGLKPATRPMGVLLFLGPTGMGKTELAKATAEFLFGSETAMTRLDMSEFMEKHTLARLIGSPPGYKDSEQEGQLTGALRRKPYSVVLLDEIEKAHPDVLNLFLQVFDDGRLTDAMGNTADASHALFIMTSNIGSTRRVGFRPHESDADWQKLLRELQDVFRPELLNRMDSIVMFRSLDMEHIEQIAHLILDKLRDRLAEQGIGLETTDEAVALLARKGFDQNYGARRLRRAIEEYVENPLGLMILRGEARDGEAVKVDVEDDAIVIRAAPTPD